MKCSSKVLKFGSSKVLFAGQGVAPMNLRASVSLRETVQTVVTIYVLGVLFWVFLR